jgi:cytoskeletal protein RodZ
MLEVIKKKKKETSKHRKEDEKKGANKKKKRKKRKKRKISYWCIVGSLFFWLIVDPISCLRQCLRLKPF